MLKYGTVWTGFVPNSVNYFQDCVSETFAVSPIGLNAHMMVEIEPICDCPCSKEEEIEDSLRCQVCVIYLIHRLATVFAQTVAKNEDRQLLTEISANGHGERFGERSTSIASNAVNQPIF